MPPSPPAAAPAALLPGHAAAAVLLPVAPATPATGHALRFGQALRQLAQDTPSSQVDPQQPLAAYPTGQAAHGTLAPLPAMSQEYPEGALQTAAPDAVLLASMWPPAPAVAAPMASAVPIPSTLSPAQALAGTTGSVPGIDATQATAAAAAGAPAATATPFATPLSLADPAATSAAPVAAAAATGVHRAPADLAEGLPLPGTDRPSLPGITGTAAQDARLPDASGAADATQPAETAARRPQALVDALGDRIAWQLQRGQERVVIRLDPPLRGQIEIQIRTDAAGATQVQLHASHGEVVRQLQAIGDHLRQELSQRQGGAEVSVQVAQQSREQDGRQRQDRQSEAQ